LESGAEIQITKESFEMIKSSEDSGKLMTVTRNSVLGNISELELSHNNMQTCILPKIQKDDNCVLLHVLIEDDKKKSVRKNEYYVVYVPTLQKMGWLWGSELEAFRSC
jgi:hypothetical protein